MYRPLPDYLTIQPSKVEGLGLFTLKDLEPYESLGMTHAHWFGEDNNLLRHLLVVSLIIAKHLTVRLQVR